MAAERVSEERDVAVRMEMLRATEDVRQLAAQRSETIRLAQLVHDTRGEADLCDECWTDLQIWMKALTPPIQEELTNDAPTGE